MQFPSTSSFFFVLFGTNSNHSLVAPSKLADPGKTLPTAGNAPANSPSCSIIAPSGDVTRNSRHCRYTTPRCPKWRRRKTFCAAKSNSSFPRHGRTITSSNPSLGRALISGLSPTEYRDMFPIKTSPRPSKTLSPSVSTSRYGNRCPHNVRQIGQK